MSGMSGLLQEQTLYSCKLWFVVLYLCRREGVLRVFKTKQFGRYAMRARIDDDSLKEAIERAERGLVDAELGGGVIKLRIARKGQGRSSGYRTLIAYHRNKRAVFLYGFAKNERENIDDEELMLLKEMAVAWLRVSDEELNHSHSKGLLQEIDYGKKN